ncbi:MAG: phosphoribosyltransferase family protein [Trueperaceae bacterium]
MTATETKVKLELPDIARKLKRLSLPAVEAVIGVATGGIAFATMVAFWLEKPLHILHLNYRDENNKPCYEKPKLLEPFDIGPTTFNKGLQPLVTPTENSSHHLLLVDDVSVTGKTLETAKNLLASFQITSLVIKGKADVVLYPEIHSCILLPWRDA